MLVAQPIFVISGPSGVGKGTVIEDLLKALTQLQLTVSATTRKSRPQEVDGQHYYFMDEDRFKRLIHEQQFVEWATVHGQYYGTLRREVDEKQKQGPVLIEIDVQGAQSIRASGLRHNSIFLMPPDEATLVERLRKRHTESEAEMARRLRQAREEMATAGQYDHVVVNDKLAETVEKIKTIIEKQIQKGVAQ